MGVVYRARQTALDRIVAVKVLLRAPFAGAEARRRFKLEAQAAARLQHPGIVGIFDIGEEEGVPWFSMEYVPGPNLERTVREFPMEGRAAARCVQLIAQALQHAHGHGVLHRDLKPSNILLDADGAPRITDFGIARLTSLPGPDAPSLTATQTGQMMGSPGYTAPEQAFQGQADARTDVYGLGALLYHLLTTRPPFQGPNLEVILEQMRSGDPLPPRRLNPAVPRDLETICLKALQKAPDSRYISAEAFAADLGRFLAGQPILARPVSLPGKLWRWTRRHPAVAAMGTIIALLLGGITAGSLHFARQQARMEHRSTLIAEARALRQQRLGGSRTAALSALQQAWAIAPSPEIRNEAIACLALPEITPLLKAGDIPQPDPSRSADGTWSAHFDQRDIVIKSATPNGQTVPEVRLPGYLPGSLLKLDSFGERLAVCAPESGDVTLLSLPEGKILATFSHPAPIASLDWSGNLIATGCDNRFIYIWDDQGQLKHRLSGHESTPILVAFRPHSQELASCAHDQYLRLWHAARGADLLRLTGGVSRKALWWSADGRKLCATIEPLPGQPPATDVFEVIQPPFSLLAPPQEEPHPENLGSAHCSPDGDLAAVIDDREARLWDFKTGLQTASWPRSPGQWLSTWFAPDHQKLWLCGWDVELTAYPLSRSPSGRLTTGPPATVLEGYGSLLRQVSPDGSIMLLSNNSQGCFLVHWPATGRTIPLPHPGVLSCALAPNGKWLVTSSYLTPGLRVWSLPDGAPQQLLCPDGTIMQTLFSPDSSRLFVHIAGHSLVFHTPDWQELPQPPEEISLLGMTFSPDGRTLATMGDNEVRLLDPDTFTTTGTLTVPAHAGWLGEAHATFDRDGSHLIVHSALGSVLRWDLTALRSDLTKLGMGF